MNTVKTWLPVLVGVVSTTCGGSAYAFSWTDAVDGVITIPGGETATVTDADVPVVAELTRINMGNYASRIVFQNDTVPLRGSRLPFSG